MHGQKDEDFGEFVAIPGTLCLSCQFDPEENPGEYDLDDYDQSTEVPVPYPDCLVCGGKGGEPLCD